MERPSNWAEISSSASLHEIDFAQIEQLRKEREKRSKVIQCMNSAVKCVESLLTTNSPNETFGLSDTFISRMKGAISTYEKSLQEKFTLNDTAPPRSLQITIKMRKDLGTIVTENGQIVLNQNCIINGSRSELIHLVRGGYADLL
jgi:hypothetical protein